MAVVRRSVPRAACHYGGYDRSASISLSMAVAIVKLGPYTLIALPCCPSNRDVLRYVQMIRTICRSADVFMVGISGDVAPVFTRRGIIGQLYMYIQLFQKPLGAIPIPIRWGISRLRATSLGIFAWAHAPRFSCNA